MTLPDSSALWITAGEFLALTPQNVFHRQLDKSFKVDNSIQDRHVLFRKEFVIDALPDKAVLSFSADDYAKIYVNGRFAGQGPGPGYIDHYLYQDIDQLKRYVSIMQARHETAPIRLYFEIDPDLYECIIPKMLLQPFVENSILHGFSRDSKNAMVREFYGTLGFEKIAADEAGNSVWTLSLADYQTRNNVIRICEADEQA